ncbi:LPS export ABC transporter permease LptG [Nitrospirillum sp. BR 11164]|uniref:LPS export ABC transporter permease LptG n=1 Tax=Nitrospirillum sp. BR 11164 TaxID=3104324 RepID=UPI002AFEA815|nr:LPS export ABC transporter permease LptG [Nitrospirillum sp. BR 11164]MEA1652297.1 LPS export ABC transporter permease LptG [Nitrospirillum sp. BR 11164]
MRISPTLSVYITRQFVFWFLIILGGMLALVLLLDTVELLRRAAAKTDATFQIVLSMALLKLPEIGQQIFPFGVLFGAMYTFFRMTRSAELVVVRAAGISVWQFMTPVLLTSLVAGIINITLLSPVFATMLARYEQLESRYLRGQQSSLDVARSGVWLRQVQEGENGNYLIHAEQVGPGKPVNLRTVTILLFNGSDQIPVGRLDSETAELQKGQWVLRNAWLNQPGRPTQHVDGMALPTDLTEARIQESFAPPDTLSFWELPSFIQTLEQAGLSSVRHRMYYESMLAVPAFFCAMVFLAGTFSLRHARRGGTLQMLGTGLVTALVLFVSQNIIQALGRSGVLPVFLAAWAPAGVCLMLGTAALLHLEDG